MKIRELSDMHQGIINSTIGGIASEVDGMKDATFYEKVEAALQKMETYYTVIPDVDDELRNEVETELKMAIQQNEIKPIVVDKGYNAWLDDMRTEINWNHRNAYYRYLLDVKHWPSGTVYSSINPSTDTILDHIGNPRSGAFFSKKGLVIGDVQSGKTASYTGLINKAIDVGYKLIIVLAGMQNDLRTQTQERLDAEVLGYKTGFSTMVSSSGEKVGVGLYLDNNNRVDALTSRGNNGDFKQTASTLTLSGDVKPLLAVLKKNTIVLENFTEFLSKEVNLDENGKLNLPVLIIDDEVDQASIDVNNDPTKDPTAINRRIREIIKLCNRVSYVGYTATPYANIFIDDESVDEKFGEDLFPKDFIVMLPTPIDYCGVKEFFGEDADLRTDLFCEVNDMNELSDIDSTDKFIRFKAQDEIKYLSGSLKDAIDDFIVASAVRRSRIEDPDDGITKKKVQNSMMIHLAAYKSPATSLSELLKEYIYDLTNLFRGEKDIQTERYKQIWEDRFKDVSINRGFNDEWDDISKELSDVFELLKVVLINGDSDEVIDYSASQTELIAVGGNKLSRGLTLEGLMISYYLRDPRAYDTAMQMGRWFGYKKKYIDLCRIYSQPELISNFVHIMDASLLLRNDIQMMNSRMATPKEFGLRVLSHPSMLPTARNKMKNGTKLDISFNEERVQVYRFKLDKKEQNFKIAESFINELDLDSNVEKKIIEGTPVFWHCDADKIMKFINDYIADENDAMSPKSKWIDYIRKLNRKGELTDWTVVLSNVNAKGRKDVTIGQYEITPAYRKCFNPYSGHDDLKAIMSPGDFSYFSQDPSIRKQYKKGYKKGDATARMQFDKKKAVLAIYPITIINDKTKTIMEEDVIGFGIWFPYTESKDANVVYEVNSVFTKMDFEEVYGDEI